MKEKSPDVSKKALFERRGEVLIKAVIEGEKDAGTITRRVLDVEQYLNGPVAIEVHRQFGLMLRIHL